MAADRSTAELERFFAERADHLMRTAVLLTGSKRPAKTFCRPRSSGCCGGGGGSTVILRVTCAGHCATWRPTATGVRAGGGRRNVCCGRGRLQDATGDVDLRDALVRLMLQLPVRQRAVLVLRYWEQLTDAETAAVLGCPEGTVNPLARAG